MAWFIVQVRYGDVSHDYWMRVTSKHGVTYVVPTTTTQQRNPLNLPSTKNNLQKPAQIKQSRESTRKSNLTRFGLDAYVLGAMKERSTIFGRRLQLIAASLIAGELQQNQPSNLSQRYKIQTLETNNSP